MKLSANILNEIAAEKNVSVEQISNIQVYNGFADFQIGKSIYTVDFTATGKLKRKNGRAVKFSATVSDFLACIS